MTYDQIKPPMDELFKKVKFDKKLLDKLIKYRTEYIFKNDQHTEFFSGNLTGVHIIRFTYKEFDHIFKDVLNIDPLKVDKIIRLSKNFNQEYKIEGDAFNHTVTYMAHRFLTSTDIKKEEDRILGAQESIMFFLLRSISALISHRFKYPADIHVAKRTYEALSNKFLIKQLGSWYNVLDYRAKAAIEKEGIHYKTLIDFEDDAKVRYILTDLQTRMSDLIKNIYAVHMEASHDGNRVKETTMVGTDPEGGLVFKDHVGGPNIYTNKINNLLTDNRIYRPTLSDIVTDIMPTVNNGQIKDMTEWMGNNYISEHNTLIKDFVEQSMLFCITYISNNKLLPRYSKDIGTLLNKLKGAISSSRSTDVNLFRLRDLGSDIISLMNSRYNDQQTAATRTGVILYFFLLSYQMVHYGDA